MIGLGAPQMSCRELVTLVTEYLEGTLGARDRRRFERHIRGCDGCTTYLEQMRETIRLAGTLSERDVSPRAREELLAAFRDWKER
ncbi:MAG TPA: zf-HC2 domain-containing protein [Solirubrobacteraceae bacterium]|nr:zf-HC2 domain-containing protein [Solirubrobacteraceae bacterium]